MNNSQPQIEIYTLDWCPYCQKAKSFLKSKGFSYQEYNIDDTPELKKEMKQRTEGAKTVPQIFIDNKLIGGYDDLLEKKNTGELKDLLGINPEKNFNQVWDVLIIGAGPSGLNSALYSARKGFKTLIISSAMGGQMVDTSEVDNYLGMSEIEGPELLYSFWDHVKKYDVNIELGETVVDIIKQQDDNIMIKTKSGRKAQTKTVILATGTTNRELGVSGEKEFKGKGVHYCTTCDGYFYSGQSVAVVGGGNSGLEGSLDLAKIGCNVELIHRHSELKGDKVLKDKVYSNSSINIHTDYEVEKIVGGNKVEKIVLVNKKIEKKKDLNVSGVFVEIGLLPNSEFIKNKVKTNDTGEIVINENNETNIRGIWAAGDVTNTNDKQIVVAAAEGAKTALRINEYLN